MKTVKIILGSIGDVKTFVSEVAKCSCEVDLVSGRYIVDAKSIMGIFSLDLTKPITLNVHSENCEDLLKAIASFIISE